MYLNNQLCKHLWDDYCGKPPRFEHRMPLIFVQISIVKTINIRHKLLAIYENIKFLFTSDHIKIDRLI